MTWRIARLRPDEELIDEQTFFELYSGVAAGPEARARKRDVDPPQVDDLAEPGPEPLPRPPSTPFAGATPPGGLPRPPSSPAATAALEREIGRCASHESVARLGVYLARSYAAAAALFLVQRGMIEGICSDGLNERGNGLLFPAAAPSLFAGVVASRQPFRGAPGDNALDQRVLRVLGRQHVQEIAVLPVAIRGRVVNLLYADNGPEALGDASVAALAAVCAQVARAYERVILERKRAERANRPKGPRRPSNLHPVDLP
jgi:GAF domain-containing protein